MKKLSLILIAITALCSFAFAQMLLPPAPSFEKEKGSNELSTFDFTVPLEGVTDPSLNLGQYAGKPTVIFYFSAKCPHCMKTYPKLDLLVEPYVQKGLNVITVATFMNSKPEILTFMENQRVRFPTFQDVKRKFTKLYGVGTVPLVILIDKDGKYIRYKSYDKNQDDLRIAIKKMMEK
jgi:thiol-disulfide isomerase/thioredoxin